MKKEIKLVDTNYIIRYLMNDNKEMYIKAFAFFEDVKLGKINVIILESVLVECVHILHKVYKVEKAVISEVLTNLLDFNGVLNDDKDELVKSLILFNVKNNLDIVDCILLFKSQKNGYELITFDKGIKKML